MKYMKEKDSMIVRIVIDDDRKEKFIIDEKEILDFSFDSLDRIITICATTEVKIIVESEETLENYKTLIEEIVKGARSKEFLEAVRAANDASKKLVD